MVNNKVVESRNDKKIKVLSFLNSEYETESGFVHYVPETATFDEAFESLRSAIAVYNKLNTDLALNDEWFKHMDYRLSMVKALQKSMDVITEGPNAKLLNCALELNGYDTTFSDFYGEPIIDTLQKFGDDYALGSGYYLGLGTIHTMALLSNIPVHLAENGSKNIRDAERFINNMVAPDSFNISMLNYNFNYIPSRSDGLLDENVYTTMIMAFQEVGEMEVTGKMDEKTREGAAHFNDHYRDNAGALIWNALIIRGYADPAKNDLGKAKQAFADDYNVVVDSQNFLIDLFTQTEKTKVEYVDNPKYIIQSVNAKYDPKMGYIDKSGFQAFSKESKNIVLVKFTTDSSNHKTDKLYSVDTSKNAKTLTFDLDQKLYDFNEDLGHTQSLIIHDDDYYLGCDPLTSYKNKWSQNIVRYKLKNNQLVNKHKVIDVKSAAKVFKNVDLNSIYRVDFAVSPDRQTFLLGLIDKQGTQYFLFYNFNDIINMFDQLKQESIEFEKAGLKPFKYFKFDKFVNDDASLDGYLINSVQGYTLDNYKNIYVGSGRFSGKKKFKMNLSTRIVKIPYSLQSISDVSILKLTYKAPFDIEDTTELENVLKEEVVVSAEAEDLQFQPDGTILQDITWQLDPSKMTGVEGLNDSISGLQEFLKNLTGRKNKEQFDKIKKLIEKLRVNYDKNYIYEIRFFNRNK